MEKKMIGIDIGGTAIKLSIVTKEGKIIEKWSIETDISNKGERISENLIQTIKKKLKDLSIDMKEISGIGVGVPGPVQQGVVKQAVNLGWKEYPLKNILEKELEIPTVLLNDANSAALGELWQASQEGVTDIIFVTLGTGVGGGIIINNKIINGAHSSGGEIGHIPISSNEERICGCGNINCLESYASATGLLQTAQKLLEKRDQYVSNTKEIFQLASQGNSDAQEAIDQTVVHLAKAIAGIMNTIDPQEVIIGGGLSEAGATLLDPLYQEINRYVFPQIRNNFSLRKAKLGNDAGMLGAVYQTIQESEQNADIT